MTLKSGYRLGLTPGGFIHAIDARHQTSSAMGHGFWLGIVAFSSRLPGRSGHK
jgi:hypothetical protein